MAYFLNTILLTGNQIELVDDDNSAFMICFVRCEHLKDSCGKIIECGDDYFDVSHYCPVTCMQEGMIASVIHNK